MSANNFLGITRMADKFHIAEYDADTEEENFTISVEDTLEKAIEIANEYQNKKSVEYGLQIKV